MGVLTVAGAYGVRRQNEMTPPLWLCAERHGRVFRHQAGREPDEAAPPEVKAPSPLCSAGALHRSPAKHERRCSLPTASLCSLASLNTEPIPGMFGVAAAGASPGEFGRLRR